MKSSLQAHGDGQVSLNSLLSWIRKEIVLLLLRYDALSSIINGTAQIPKDMTEDDEIITMLEGMKWLDFFFSRALSVSCPYSLKLSFFFQLQTGERWHERRESFWKLQERGTSPLCLTWSENVCAAVYCQKHTDVEGLTLHPEQILPHLCWFCVFYFY